MPSALSASQVPNQFVECNGRRLAYRVIGDGTPMVLCLRFRGVMDSWDPAFLDELAELGFKVHVFDYSGLGLSGGTRTYDPASLIDTAGATTTVTVTGAALGDFVPMVSFDKDLQGITVTAYVSAANTVSVRFQNESGGTLDLASGTLRVVVAKASNFSSTVLLGMESST